MQDTAMQPIVTFLTDIGQIAHSNLLFLVVNVAAWASVAIGWYTRAGSGIYNHAYGKRYSGAPGARIPVEGASGRDPQADMSIWTRGTR